MHLILDCGIGESRHHLARHHARLLAGVARPVAEERLLIRLLQQLHQNVLTSGRSVIFLHLCLLLLLPGSVLESVHPLVLRVAD